MKKLFTLFSVLLALFALTGCSTADQSRDVKIKLPADNISQVIIDYDRSTGNVVRVDTRYFPPDNFRQHIMVSPANKEAQ